MREKKLAFTMDLLGEATITEAEADHVQKQYFDLLNDKPDSAQWLALGSSVSFALAGEVYEIYE